MLNQKSFRVVMTIATLSCSLSLVACGSGKEESKPGSESAPQTSGDKKSGDKSGGKNSPKAIKLKCFNPSYSGFCMNLETTSDLKDKKINEVKDKGGLSDLTCTENETCSDTDKEATCDLPADGPSKASIVYYKMPDMGMAVPVYPCPNGTLTYHH